MGKGLNFLIDTSEALFYIPGFLPMRGRAGDILISAEKKERNSFRPPS
jgi:hypothetical protein